MPVFQLLPLLLELLNLDSLLANSIFENFVGLHLLLVLVFYLLDALLRGFLVLFLLFLDVLGSLTQLYGFAGPFGDIVLHLLPLGLFLAKHSLLVASPSLGGGALSFKSCYLLAQVTTCVLLQFQSRLLLVALVNQNHPLRDKILVFILNLPLHVVEFASHGV